MTYSPSWVGKTPPAWWQIAATVVSARSPRRAETTNVNYEGDIQSAGFGLATLGGLAFVQLWLPLVAISVVVVAAILIRLCFRRNKAATDV